MSRLLTIVSGLLLCATTVQSQEKSPPATDEAARQYKLLIDEFEEDGEAREVAGQFIALAEQYPNSPVAVDSLAWVIDNVSRGMDLGRATTLLATSHLQSKRLESVCRQLPSRPSLQSEKLLRELREKNPHKDVRAQASFHLAVYLKRQLVLIEAFRKEKANRQQFEQFYGKDFTEHLDRLDMSESLKDIETIYEDVSWKFSNIRLGDSTMGRTARRELYAIRNLSPGRTAPEITGQDVDGNRFKLSDYRGKVVLLDFWGHW